MSQLFAKRFDFVVIGGGIIGLCVAREIKRKFPKETCALLEKESECGLHASGRNSGVLHAGFYYTADSLKARFCKVGNERLSAYCTEKGISINRCGKLVVAKNEEELKGLQELLRRAEASGVKLELITRAQAEKIEPRVKTFEQALFSPTTASVNPKEVMRAMQRDAVEEGIEILVDTAYLRCEGKEIVTSRGVIEAGYVVNAAGLYADRIARDFGFSKRHRVLPFKGLYLYSNEPAGALRTNIYPVPDLNYPFLGVHFTLTDTGKVKIGPTAIPALWREQYQGWAHFKMEEFLEIAKRQMKLVFSSSFDFKRLAFEEVQKYWGRKMVRLAGELLKGVERSQYRQWGTPGIRAQLINIEKGKLETDFVLEGDRASFHILNAVSPGFTSAIAFAEYAVQEMQRVRQASRQTAHPRSLQMT